MTAVEEGVQGSAVGVQEKPAEPSRAPQGPERSTAGPARSRFAAYFARTGWVHALLLLSVWLFLFPFFWMLATSMKTDEEIAENELAPAVLTFRPSSPYVKPPLEPAKPSDVTADRWNEMLPQLRDKASAAIAQYQKSLPPEATIDELDARAYRESAASRLVNDAVAKIDRRLWATETDRPLLNEFGSLLTDSSIAAAMSDALARFELFTFQVRTLDMHIYNLTEGSQFADTWRIESGPARLFKTGGTTRLSYHFDSASSEPIVLRHDFRLPAGVKPADLHKIIVSIGADNSWHRANAILDVGGDRWQSDSAIAIAQFRPMSLLFQPPTFDDELMRAKVWTSLRKTGATPASSPQPETIASIPGGGEPATLRITITPSSTIRANFEKARRNYVRAFRSVPFWRYIGNSVALVALCTLGSLFSASFVAYAFARLHWPGRSIAFLLLLSTMMLPGQVTMIPGFMVWRAVHWYNTLNPLWVPAFFGSAFFIFLMTQQMRTIPKELEEAARLDGLNALQSWYYVILPQVKPVLAAIAILSFINAWNDFLGPLIYLRDQTKFPLSLGLYGLGLLRAQGGADYNWTVVMAGNMLMTVPVIVVFFLFQRYFVQGMTMTGMKG